MTITVDERGWEGMTTIGLRASWIGRLRGWVWRMLTAASGLTAERCREEARFIELVERHGETINRICRSFSYREGDFDDLRQDALVNIWRGLQSFRNESELRTWLYRVTLNTCVSTYRKRPKGEFVDVMSMGNVLPDMGDEMDDSKWLQTLVGELPEIDRAIIVMWLEDLSYDEIADVMGMKRNTVATRIRRTKDKLRTIIEKDNI